jgi:hypothetical protein
MVPSIRHSRLVTGVGLYEPRLPGGCHVGAGST